LSNFYKNVLNEQIIVTRPKDTKASPKSFTKVIGLK